MFGSFELSIEDRNVEETGVVSFPYVDESVAKSKVVGLGNVVPLISGFVSSVKYVGIIVVTGFSVFNFDVVSDSKVVLDVLLIADPVVAYVFSSD